MLLPLFSKSLNATPVQIGLIFSFFFLPRISEGYFSVLADKLGKKPVLLKGLFFCALFFLLMFFVENILWLFVMSFLLSLLGFSIILPPLMGRTSDLIPKGKWGEMTGVAKCFSCLGNGFAPVTAGVIADALGLRYVFLLGSFVASVILLYSIKKF
jgi:MFS family permease